VMSAGIAQEVVDIAWRIYSSLKMHIIASKSDVNERTFRKGGARTCWNEPVWPGLRGRGSRVLVNLRQCWTSEDQQGLRVLMQNSSY
jgi:hypothetical protein